MNKDIRFLKLYSKHEEGNIIDSIITYTKWEFLYENGVCIQYKKFIRINLWLIIINICWLTKSKINNEEIY